MSAGAKRREKKEQPKEEEENRFVQWRSLLPQHIDELLENTVTVEEVQLVFEEILGLRNQQTCMKEAALLQFYVCGFWWAKESDFTPTQTSFTIAVLHTLLDNIREKQMGLVDNMMELAKAIAAARHHPDSEGNTTPLLDVEQSTALIDYIKSSLFQNYTLYQLLFSTAREQLLIGMEVESGEMQRSLDKQDEENVEKEEAREEFGEYSIREVKEVVEEVTRDLLGSLQADFSEKLRLQEEDYTARLERLKTSAAK